VVRLLGVFSNFMLEQGMMTAHGYMKGFFFSKFGNRLMKCKVNSFFQ